MRRQEQGGGEVVTRPGPCGLLLGLGSQPPRLRPELGEDVLDPGKVRLRFDQLVLRPPSPAFVAPRGTTMVPAVVGVPEITPVAATMLRPFVGSVLAE